MRVPLAKVLYAFRFGRLRVRLGLLVLVPLIGINVSTVRLFGVEQADLFLQGLLDRNLYQQALDYLEQMQSSPLVDDSFRNKILYHQGVTLLEQSRHTVDPTAQARLLQDAQARLEKFAAENPGNISAAEAQMQLAMVFTEQGKRGLAHVARLPDGNSYTSEREKLRGEARSAFERAVPLFQAAVDAYDAELKKTSPTNAEGSEAASTEEITRQELRGRLAQARVLAAQNQFEIAQTHSSESPEFRQLHEAAAKELAKLYEDHSRWLVGFYARLYEGRCYQALAQFPLALGCYEDILNQSNVLPAFRPLMAKASRHRAECFIAQGKFDAAIESARDWLSSARSSEEKDPEWLAVRYRLAEALQRKGESLQAESLDRRKYLAEARDAYRLASSAPNEFQASARAASAALSRGGRNQLDPPRTFQEAYDRGKESLASMNASKMALPMAQNNNPAAVPELEAQIEQGKTDARANFERALALRDDDTDLAKLNEVRYFLCWLNYDDGDYYRAAVLGEFLARRYPDHSAAASAAKLAMASYEQLHLSASKENTSPGNDDFEARRMAEMAEFITRRWPKSEDAEAAFGILVSYAIRNDRIGDAIKLLEQVSEESRPRFELQLGIASWGRYLELSQKQGAERMDDATLKELKESAIRFLTSGYSAASRDSEVNTSVAAAGLYLAQAAISEGSFDEAIRLLEAPAIGPLTLIAEHHPAVDRQTFTVEAYKAALRAYVSASPPQSERAVEIMNDLEAAIGSGEKSADQLTRIYVGLGIALEQQIGELRSSGKEQEAEHVGAAFVEFLDRIAARQENTDWPVRQWIAQTYFNLGTGSSTNTATNASTRSKSSQEYLVKAREGYASLIEAADADPSIAPSATSILGAKFRLGECYRELGEYKKAIDTFSSILMDKESSLVVQRAAALAYQQRGDAENYRWYERAIYGGQKVKSTGENRVWGWLKLAQVAENAARSNPSFLNTFFEARLNSARCRYLAGMKQTGAAKKKDIAVAEQSVRSTFQLYPDLGGDRWRAEFDALLKQIQSAAGEKPLGLKAIAAPTPAS